MRKAQLMMSTRNPVPQRFHHRQFLAVANASADRCVRRNHQGVQVQASTDGGSVLVIAVAVLAIGLALILPAMRPDVDLNPECYAFKASALLRRDDWQPGQYLATGGGGAERPGAPGLHG